MTWKLVDKKVGASVAHTYGWFGQWPRWRFVVAKQPDLVAVFAETRAGPELEGWDWMKSPHIPEALMSAYFQVMACAMTRWEFDRRHVLPGGPFAGHQAVETVANDYTFPDEPVLGAYWIQDSAGQTEIVYPEEPRWSAVAYSRAGYDVDEAILTEQELRIREDSPLDAVAFTMGVLHLVAERRGENDEDEDAPFEDE